jgi:hypothetical protein
MWLGSIASSGRSGTKRHSGVASRSRTVRGCVAAFREHQKAVRHALGATYVGGRRRAGPARRLRQRPHHHAARPADPGEDHSSEIRHDDPGHHTAPPHRHPGPYLSRKKIRHQLRLTWGARDKDRGFNQIGTCSKMGVRVSAGRASTALMPRIRSWRVPEPPPRRL